MSRRESPRLVLLPKPNPDGKGTLECDHTNILDLKLNFDP